MTENGKKPKATMYDAIHAFLSLKFEEPKKPYRTQREMREDAMRIVGYTQAQEGLRHLLSQVSAGRGRDQARRLAEVRADGQLKPMDGPGGMKLWLPPEFEVKRRR